MHIRMRAPLRSIALVTAALVVPQAVAGPVAAGSAWDERGGERRTTTFVCNEHPSGEIRGFARMTFSDPAHPAYFSAITSVATLADGTVCMAGPLLGMPQMTFFFAVRDNGAGPAHRDEVSNILIAPPGFETVQAILDFIGGSVPPEQWNTVSGGEVRTF